LLSSIVFHVIPTALEVSMVCGILVSPDYAQMGLQIAEPNIIELEVRMELRCRYRCDNASLRMVHDQNYSMAVSLV